MYNASWHLGCLHKVSRLCFLLNPTPQSLQSFVSAENFALLDFSRACKSQEVVLAAAARERRLSAVSGLQLLPGSRFSLKG